MFFGAVLAVKKGIEIAKSLKNKKEVKEEDLEALATSFIGNERGLNSNGRKQEEDEELFLPALLAVKKGLDVIKSLKKNN